MHKFKLPYIRLPGEFCTLLKSNLSMASSIGTIFDALRSNPALYRLLEVSLSEFNDGRGTEKLISALGWPNLRERTASLYIHKSIYGNYPVRSNMQLVEDIKSFENKFIDHGVHGYSRAFLLGFYLKLTNIKFRSEIKVSDEVSEVLKVSQGRSEKVDWLILIVQHLVDFIGAAPLIKLVVEGKKLEEIYRSLPLEARKEMHQNLMAYGASINEPDVFLYEKV